MLRHHKPLLLILFSGLLLRAGYFLLVFFNHPETFWAYDSGEYWRIAENLLAAGKFSSDNGAPFVPNNFRTPTYPFFLAGTQLMGGGLFLTIILQHIVGVVTIWLTWKTARIAAIGERGALIAASLVAVDIPSLVLSNYVLTESIFTLLLLGSIYFLLKYLKTKAINSLVLAGLFLGLSALTRPVSLYLPFFLLPFLFLYLRRWKSITPALIFTTIFLLTITPWLLRNKATFKQTFFSTASDFIPAAWHAPAIIAKKKNKTVASARKELWEKWFYNAPHDPYHEPIKYHRFIAAQASEIMFAHPITLVQLQGEGIISFLLKPVRGQLVHQLTGYSEFNPGHVLKKSGQEIRQHTPAGVWVLVVMQFVMLAVVYIGILLLLWRRRHWRNPVALIVLFLFLFYFANAIVPTATNARLRVPIVPVLAILAGAGFSIYKFGSGKINPA